jgi:hypothetical protein
MNIVQENVTLFRLNFYKAKQHGGRAKPTFIFQFDSVN